MYLYSYWNSNQYDTIHLFIQQSNTPLYSYRYSNFLIQQSNTLPCSYWYNNNLYWILSMNKTTAHPLLEDPHRCASQERLGGRHAIIQDYEFRVIILCSFYCFAICVTRYLPLRRPISREDAHRMYPRYLRVFLYVIIYCPLPHQSLWERLGVSLSCTCAAFSPLC